ncbi:MAG: class I SAM-dependent methyltransferase [Steroidobacteraceae bacterium]
MDHSIHLSVYSCRHCGFVQIPPILEEEYYDDYLMGTTHSLQMQAYQDSQAERFVGEYGLEGKRVIEVGCGDGSFLDHLSAKGALVSGIEPSARFRTRALARGHNVEEGYISADRKLSGGAFDGFVTRQVLEHVPDIHGFLTGIRNNLAPGAVGLIEVPSLEKALKDQRYYDFFADHVNYFSLDTLRLAVELNGFKVLEQYHDMYDEYNVVHVRVADRSDLSAVQATLFSLGSELHDLISNASAQGKRVIMWGSGGKGLSVLAAAEFAMSTNS